MMKIAISATGLLLLSACASYAGSDDTSAGTSAMACNADAAQYHIGHDATAAMGAAILKDSGAQTLRWGPPNSAWTMDMRPDRVSVRYGADMKITEITCG